MRRLALLLFILATLASCEGEGVGIDIDSTNLQDGSQAYHVAATNIYTGKMDLIAAMGRKCGKKGYVIFKESERDIIFQCVGESK